MDETIGNTQGPGMDISVDALDIKPDISSPWPSFQSDSPILRESFEDTDSLDISHDRNSLSLSPSSLPTAPSHSPATDTYLTPLELPVETDNSFSDSFRTSWPSYASPNVAEAQSPSLPIETESTMTVSASSELRSSPLPTPNCDSQVDENSSGRTGMSPSIPCSLSDEELPDIVPRSTKQNIQFQLWNRISSNETPIDYSLNRRRAPTMPASSRSTIESPCVVDLTEDDDEDEDEISIVATEQTVQYLGSERKRGRKRHVDRSEAAGLIQDDIPSHRGSSSGRSRRSASSSYEPSPLEVVTFFGDLLNDVVTVEDVVTETETPVADGSQIPSIVNPQINILDRGDRSRSPSSRRVRLPSPETYAADFLPSAFRRVVPESSTFASLMLPEQPYPQPFPAPGTSRNTFFNSLDTSNRNAPPEAMDYFRNIPPIPSTSTAAPSNSTSSTPAGGAAAASTPGGGELACPICFDAFHELKKQGKSVSSTTCGHMFCTHCLEESLKQAKSCPTCRRKLTKKQYHKVFLQFLG